MPKLKGLICYICGKTESKYWYRDYDSNNKWTGRRLCYECKLDIDKDETRKIRERRLKERKCHKCGSTETDIDYRTDNPIWIKYRDNKGYWDGESFLCNYCYQKNYRENNICSWYNIRKSVAQCRTDDVTIKEFDNLSENEIGRVGEEIVCKTLNIKNANIESDNFKSKTDTEKHYIYGFVQSKIRTLEIFEMKWYCSIGKSRKFDTIIILCMDEFQPWNNVERVYAIPIQIIGNQVSITISKNPSRGGLKWEKFRIDEKPFNDTYHNMEIYGTWIKRYHNI